MITSIYNWYNQDEYVLAKSQLLFFQNKLKYVENENCNEYNKGLRRQRIELVIRCIKYTYNL
jgi:hypothetical protein